jgi:hypothetical protein
MLNWDYIIYECQKHNLHKILEQNHSFSDASNIYATAADFSIR